MARKRRNVPREPNGRASRSKATLAADRQNKVEDMLREPIAARARLTGLNEDVFRNWAIGKPNPLTHHGLLCLQGYIGLKQWGAASFYLATRAEGLRALSCPANGAASESNSRGYEDTDKYTAWATSAVAAWKEMLKALQYCSTVNRSPIISAFDVILDREFIMPHMMGDLRLGLNHIDLKFVIGNKKAA